jgi:methionyl-tRNA synthetase
LRLDQGIYGIIDMVKAVNRYLEIKQPWTLAKQEDKAPLHVTVLLRRRGVACSRRVVVAGHAD